jgi:hypothetical protein
MAKVIDHLDADPIIPGQEWICVSFLSPENLKSDVAQTHRAFKFRGAFGTKDEAEKHAKMLQEKLDPDFHIFVGEGFKWLPFDPKPDTVEKQEYREPELNNLMASYKENLLLAKQHENERKKKCMQEALQASKAAHDPEVTRDKLRAKLEKKMDPVDIENQLKEVNADAQNLETDIRKLENLYKSLKKK